MAQIQTHWKDESEHFGFDSQDVITIPTEEGILLLADAPQATMRLKLTWEEYGYILLKATLWLNKRHTTQGKPNA